MGYGEASEGLGETQNTCAALAFLQWLGEQPGRTLLGSLEATVLRGRLALSKKHIGRISLRTSQDVRRGLLLA